jgi:UDP-glucuronate decarboxylase
LPIQDDLDLLADYLKNFNKIVVTGSTGWLGKETISLLQRSLGTDFNERVICVAGRKNSPTTKLKTSTISWDEFTNLKSVDLLIHLAFLNREKSFEVGLRNFITINQKITSDVSSFLIKNPGCYVLNASSGAADFYPPNIKSEDPMYVYSALKERAEKQFLSLSETCALINMRIWNISGEHISSRSPFLIVDLIQQVKSNGEIHIKGNSQSTRTYVDAQEMLLTFILALREGTRLTIDSGGALTTYENLATEILKRAGISSDKLFLHGEGTPVNNYVPRSNSFMQLANEFDIQVSTLSQQVEKVFRVVM